METNHWYTEKKMYSFNLWLIVLVLSHDLRRHIKSKHTFREQPSLTERAGTTDKTTSTVAAALNSKHELLSVNKNAAVALERFCVIYPLTMLVSESTCCIITFFFLKGCSRELKSWTKRVMKESCDYLKDHNPSTIKSIRETDDQQLEFVRGVLAGLNVFSKPRMWIMIFYDDLMSKSANNFRINELKGKELSQEAFCDWSESEPVFWQI